MNTNNKRLNKLIKGAGLTQEQALVLFNRSRPPLFKPYALSSWKAFFCSPDTTRHRKFGDALLARAETIFGKLQKSVL